MNSVKSKYFKKYIINLNKLSEMSKLKERFLKEKLNLIEKQENDYYNLFKNKFSHFESLVQDFKSVANEYKVQIFFI